MPNFSEISNGTKLLLGAGILLLIDTFLAWQKVSFGNDVISVSASRNAWHGFWGIVMCLALILLLAWVVIQVLNVKLNFELPISEAMLTLALAVIVFAFALLKNLIDDFSTWESYVGVVLAALVAIGAWLRAQELGGVDFAMARSRDTTRTDTVTQPASSTMPPTTPAAPGPSEPAMPPVSTEPEEPDTPSAPRQPEA